MTPCGLVEVYRHLEDTLCLHLQGWVMNQSCTNFSRLPPDRPASHSRRRNNRESHFELWHRWCRSHTACVNEPKWFMSALCNWDHWITARSHSACITWLRIVRNSNGHGTLLLLLLTGVEHFSRWTYLLSLFHIKHFNIIFYPCKCTYFIFSPLNYYLILLLLLLLWHDAWKPQ
jgi:hypothetical protein